MAERIPFEEEAVKRYLKRWFLTHRDEWAAFGVEIDVNDPTSMAALHQGASMALSIAHEHLFGESLLPISLADFAQKKVPTQ